MPDPRPLIGVTTSFKDGKHVLDVRYTDAIVLAGGLPVILPAVQDSEVAAALLDPLDGLMIPGGPAIVEGLIGALPDDISETDPRRVASDNLYLDAWSVIARPTLGICYGMQLLNARAGGTIFGDVQRSIENTLTHSDGRGGDLHPMNVESGTHLAEILGAGAHEVNTYHIQALESVGSGFRVAARAPDGVVEAIENDDGSILGLQFHPERQIDDMLPVFRRFVAQAGGRRA